MLTTTAAQGKYFLVEESQARQSAGENVVELGFLVSNIQIPSKRPTKDSLSVFTRFFRPRATVVGLPSPQSSPPGQTIDSIAGSSLNSSQRSTQASDKRATFTSRTSTRQPSVMRDSKSVQQYPSCAMRVYRWESDIDIDRIKFPMLPEENWREVFQSDVSRIVNLVPVTITSLLLLEVPPIISTNGIDKRDRPLRIELWVGAASSKRGQPDTLAGLLETTTGKILKETGSPKRFPHSASCQSTWAKFYLTKAEDFGSSSSPASPDESTLLEIRVGFPDRLISVGVPASEHEEDVTQWRLSPLFSGPTLRGLTFCPVSRGFQAPVSEAGEMSIEKTLIEPKKKMRRFMKNSSTLMEFREEMAEMPLNLLIPAFYLEQAALVLEQVASSYVARTKADIQLIKKVAHNDLALTSSDMAHKRTIEAIDKLERFAAEASEKGLERAKEMRQISNFYRDMWSIVVTGVVGADKKLLLAAASSRSHTRTSTAQSNASKRDNSLSSLPPPPMSSSSPSMVSETIEEEPSSRPATSESPIRGHMGEVDLSDLPPPPSTPNPFSDVMLARNSDYSGGGASPGSVLVDEDIVDDEEDRQDLLMKEDFEKTAGVRDATLKPGEEILTTFRPSTSRKDRRLRFMPINMHIQVLTVRETVVRRPVEKKPSQAETKHSAGTQGGVRQRLKSVADLVTSSKGLLGGSPAVPSSPFHRSKASDPDKDPSVVPPMSEETDGPLMLQSRRKGRQSILQSTLNLTSSLDDHSAVGPLGVPATSPRGIVGRFTSNSSAGTNSRHNTLALDDDDDEAAGGSGAAGSTPGAGQDDAESFFYDTISAGAPSAHHLTSKYGGLWQMFRELTRAKEEMRRTRDDGKCDLVTKIEAYRKAKELEWAFGERADVVLPQALSIIAGSVVARVYVMAAEYSASVVGGFEEPDDEVAQSIIKHGFLIGWESLLSTHGKELAMLGDLFYAVRYFSEHAMLRLETFEPTEEARGEEDDPTNLIDDALNVKLLRTTAKVKKPTAVGGEANGGNWIDNAAWMGPGCSEDGTVWLIVARIPSGVVEKLPKVLREYIEKHGQNGQASLFDLPTSEVVDLEQVQPKPLVWTCVLFTQGINEMQNIANTFGSRALQEEINEFSCLKLVEYCRRRFASSSSSSSSSGAASAQKKISIMSQSGGAMISKEAQAKDEERRRRAEVAYKQSLMWAAKLKVAVSNQSNTSKSFEILQNSADLVRWLSGIRIASCKSAKDRTAMSLTWEEARILHNVHFVRDIGLLELANLFREHGTRLINVHKNTGVPRYAFNKTQRGFLPESYRPPLNTIGGYFGMSNVT